MVLLPEEHLKFSAINLKYIVLYARSTEPNEISENQKMGEKKGVVRVTDYVQCVVISDAGKDSMNCESKLSVDRIFIVCSFSLVVKSKDF